MKTGQGLRNQSLRPQGTNESHNIEIISKGFRDYLRTEYRWEREGCRQGPLLLRVGKMARNQQQIQKRMARGIGLGAWRLVPWGWGFHTHLCLALKITLDRLVPILTLTAKSCFDV